MPLKQQTDSMLNALAIPHVLQVVGMRPTGVVMLGESDVVSRSI